MRLRILYDNTIAKRGFTAGWGFSCLINENLLFDTGEYPEILAHNMDLMGVKSKSISKIVISHDHYDHNGGLNWLLSEKPSIDVYIGTEFSSETILGIERNNGNICYAEDWTEIVKDIFLSEEFTFNYKGLKMSERGIVMKTVKGIVLLTGCSHPGILKIIRSVREHFKEEEFLFAAGGFHLKDTDEESIKEIVKQIKKAGVKQISATHCSGDVAIDIFKFYYGNNFISLGAGREINI